MNYKLEIPYFLEGLEGARNLFTKIILMDLYKIQEKRGESEYILLNSNVMCRKFEIDRKTYFNSIKKLNQLGYIERDTMAFINEIIETPKGKFKKKQTKIKVNLNKVIEQFSKNDLKMEEIENEIRDLYLKNNSKI